MPECPWCTLDIDFYLVKSSSMNARLVGGKLTYSAPTNKKGKGIVFKCPYCKEVLFYNQTNAEKWLEGNLVKKCNGAMGKNVAKLGLETSKW